MAAVDVSIIVPSWNTRELLGACLESACDPTVHTETIVVDNGSRDGSPEFVESRFPSVRLLRSAENRGFPAAANQGARVATGRHLLFLNRDARLLPGALGALLDVARMHADAGVVGARILNVDGSFQASHTRFPTLASEFLVLSGLGRLFRGAQYPSAGPDEGAPRPVDWVSGACFLVRREALAAVSGFDEDYFLYAEETDLCYRLRLAGWRTWYQPAAQVLHIGEASLGGRRPDVEAHLYRSRVRFFRKHRGPAAARMLRAQIYGFTAVKRVAHGFVRLVSRERFGRQVISLRRLATHLRDDA
ncbi:MAG: glycosyltransferase family 2 protein [Candidatus Binatia bacterium]